MTTISKTHKDLSPEEREALISILQARFEVNPERHPGIAWEKVQARLDAQPEKLSSLQAMEATGGEPDLTRFDDHTGEAVFVDCSAESPAGRRNLCYDREALDTRKSFKPADTVVDMAAAMGIELLTEEQFRDLQKIGHFDEKTSSWLKTPAEVRILGGAIFGDYRYGRVFIYHNGASSYYGARGFRGLLKI